MKITFVSLLLDRIYYYIKIDIIIILIVRIVIMIFDTELLFSSLQKNIQGVQLGGRV